CSTRHRTVIPQLRQERHLCSTRHRTVIPQLRQERHLCSTECRVQRSIAAPWDKEFQLRDVLPQLTRALATGCCLDMWRLIATKINISSAHPINTGSGTGMAAVVTARLSAMKIGPQSPPVGGAES